MWIILLDKKTTSMFASKRNYKSVFKVGFYMPTEGFYLYEEFETKKNAEAMVSYLNGGTKPNE